MRGARIRNEYTFIYNRSRERMSARQVTEGHTLCYGGKRGDLLLLLNSK